MLISLKKNLCILAMPKTGTTALEQVLAPHCDLVFTGDPRVKHTPWRRYSRFLVPYLAELGRTEMETACVIRHPEDWLGSWYRYRARPALDGHKNSTASLSFDDFVTGYLAKEKPAFAKVGSPARFVSDKSKTCAVTHLYKYDNFAAYQDFLSARFGQAIAPPVVNASPRMELSLSGDLRRELQAAMALDYEIYETAK